MTDPSPMSSQETFEDTTSAISSQASAGGLMPSSLPSGETNQSGPEAVPANPSPWRERERARLTSGTFGQPFSVSSPSADLQLSLESRLLVRMARYGSPEYALKWSRSPMQWGEQICALRALARPTSGKDSIGWPTPQAHDSGASGAGTRERGTATVSLPNLIAGWMTPREKGDARGTRFEQGEVRNLEDQLKLAGWATPAATDTPRSPESARNRIAAGHQDDLPTQVGRIPPSSNAETESFGASRLNPLFSLWLQGFPAEEWASCGVRETQ